MLQIVILLIAGAIVLACHWAALRTCHAKLEAEAELAYLSGRLIEAQESERRRIASEIQNGIGDQLEVVAQNLDGL
jgi:signal transduction histidine kinase